MLPGRVPPPRLDPAPVAGRSLREAIPELQRAPPSFPFSAPQRSRHRISLNPLRSNGLNFASPAPIQRPERHGSVTPLLSSPAIFPRRSSPFSVHGNDTQRRPFL